MSRKHEKTLAALFADPTRANIAWKDVESLLEFLGADVTEGRGSRVRVALNGVRATFHEPHPGKEIGKGMAQSMRDFLRAARVRP
jgi:hypothetical protein